MLGKRICFRGGFRGIEASDFRRKKNEKNRMDDLVDSAPGTISTSFRNGSYGALDGFEVS